MRSAARSPSAIPRCASWASARPSRSSRRRACPRRWPSASTWPSCSGSHAIGHTRMATESAVTTEHSHPFSTGLDLCLVHNGSLVQPQPAAPVAAAPRHRVPDRQRHRGRGRLSDLAAARGRDRSTRRSRRRSTTSTASTPSRSAPRTASPCCATPSPASPRCSPRPTTGWRWPRSTARSRICRAPRRRRSGSRRRRGLQLGAALSVITVDLAETRSAS